MADAKEVLRKTTSWTAFIAGWLTVIIGLVRIFDSGASLEWPSNFIDDVNDAKWRQPLFSFAPNVFADVWTPFVMGLAAVVAHFETWQKATQWQTSSFGNLGLYHTVMALFGCMGYAGGLGIIFSSLSWLVVLLALIIFFWCDASACLELKLNLNFKLRNRDGQAGGAVSA